MTDANLPIHSAQHGATGRNKKFPAAQVVAAIVKRPQELAPRQQHALELLLRGCSDAQVALQVGVDRGTVFRWRKNAKFVQRLEQFRELLWRESQTRLETLIGPALDVLQQQIAGEDPKAALRAAAVLLRNATPARLERGPDYLSPRIELDEPDDVVDEA